MNWLNFVRQPHEVMIVIEQIVIVVIFVVHSAASTWSLARSILNTNLAKIQPASA